LIKLFNKSSSKITYVTRHSRYLNVGRYLVILSPDYYWIKKEKLPVKSISKAKKLAPSVFEGSLPKGNYQYEVRKSGDEFIIIAYDRVEIADRLKEIFPTKSTITAVYFAQDLLGSIDECVSIDEKSALTNIDSILVQVPRKCSNTTSTINDYLDRINLNSAKRVNLSSGGAELFDRKDLIILSTLFGVVALSLLLKYISYKIDIKNLEKSRAKIVKEYNLPPTMIQIKSIKRSLDKKFKQQKILRDRLYELSKIDLKRGEYISKVQFDGKRVDLTIHIADNKRAKSIKESIASKLKIISDALEGDNLHLRIAI